MAYLLDTNILLRLFAEEDPRHEEVEAAVGRLSERGEALHFAPQNAAELWNVATCPLDRNGFGYTPSEADVQPSEPFGAGLGRVCEVRSAGEREAAAVSARRSKQP